MFHGTSPTIKEVASVVGLSPAAVSLALRNHRSIPPATRQRIRPALARKFPNAAAATEGANWLSSFLFLAERTKNENDWRRT